MSDCERCCQCDSETGRAGRADDSIYVRAIKGPSANNIIGPLCEECYESGLLKEEWVSMPIESRLTDLREKFGVSSNRIKELESELLDRIKELEDTEEKLRQLTESNEGLRAKMVCEWTEENDGEYYSTKCGQAHCFIEGGITENNHKFCPYCGGTIILSQLQEKGQ
jgi:hypothetical protein